jgi:hypothetical protein
MLTEINCAWLLHIQAPKTYDVLGRVTPILTRRGSVLQEDEINIGSLQILHVFDESQMSSQEITPNFTEVEIISSVWLIEMSNTDS